MSLAEVALDALATFDETEASCTCPDAHHQDPNCWYMLSEEVQTARRLGFVNSALDAYISNELRWYKDVAAKAVAVVQNVSLKLGVVQVNLSDLETLIEVLKVTEEGTHLD